jgi:hypothetical protein
MDHAPARQRHSREWLILVTGVVLAAALAVTLVTLVTLLFKTGGDDRAVVPHPTTAPALATTPAAPPAPTTSAPTPPAAIATATALPCPALAGAAPAAAIDYQTPDRKTVAEIAVYFGAPPEQLATLYGLTPQSAIPAGCTVRIPQPAP